MADVFYGTITSEMKEGIDISSYTQDVPQLQTQINDTDRNIQTIMEDNTHRIQSIMQGVVPNITTLVNAPWVTVTSINGMTGDVIVEYILQGFQTNHWYKKDTIILWNGRLYFAKKDFNSGDEFNEDDWTIPDFEQVQADWATEDKNEKSYIRNKPTQISQFEKDLDFLNMIYPVGSVYQTTDYDDPEDIGELLLGTWQLIAYDNYEATDGAKLSVYKYKRTK